MKKIIALLCMISIFSQFCFVVNANASVLYEMDSDRFLVPDGQFAATVKGKEVKTGDDPNETEPFVYINDIDATESSGLVIQGPNPGGIITVTTDIKWLSSSVNTPKLYINTEKGGYAVCLDFSALSISHYDGTMYHKAALTMPQDVWRNITVVFDTSAMKFDLYMDGAIIGKDFPCRAKTMNGDLVIWLQGDQTRETNFYVKNFKIYSGTYVPELSVEMKQILPEPERMLVDYKDAPARLKSKLKGAVAMTIGNSVARVDNKYVNIYEGEPYVAPYISEDGSTLIPARFASEAIGCTVEALSGTDFRISKDGTVIELKLGDKNAIVNGAPVAMPTAPVLNKDRLFLPLRFAAESFGKNVFWDNRGLIVISDGKVVNEGEEDIIKPLISEIRSYTTVWGNKKYSDVNESTRNITNSQIESVPAHGLSTDVTKRFMATVNRWVYVSSAKAGAIEEANDLGILVQGTLSANMRDPEEPNGAGTAKLFDGSAYTRSDGVMGTTWGCQSNPVYWENIKTRIRQGIDNGVFTWQFDDWPVNEPYTNGGCFCEYCIKDFAKYLATEISAEKLAELGISDPANFDYKQWVIGQGAKTNLEAVALESTPIGKVWNEFEYYRNYNFHKNILAYMKEYSGNRNFMSFNGTPSLSYFTEPTGRYNWLSGMYDLVDGTMGETSAGGTAASAIYNAMLTNKAIGNENIISPLPKTDAAKEMMYSGIAMAYATGQHILVPWSAWLYGSTRYYATVEELGGVYAFAREYPFLLDNYEAPEKIGYIVDLYKADALTEKTTEWLEKGIPAKFIFHRECDMYDDYYITSDKLKGVNSLVALTDTSDLTAEENAAIAATGLNIIPASDTAAIASLENSLWTVRNSTESVYTTLRQNQLYDNAPVVVHAVNYDLNQIRKNVEIEINNIYLPEGDELTVNVFKPMQNRSSMRVKKGAGTTKITIDSIDRWTVLQISGVGTVHREENFSVSDNYSGIGMGSRISNDKAYGTPSSLRIETYGEGIYSTTYGDSGTQDEAAFVYKRLGKGKLKQAIISAGFVSAPGAHGVMVRDDIYSNARFVALMYDEANGLRIAHRDVVDKTVLYEKLESTVHDYLRLERRGKKYHALVSSNGKTFTEVGSYAIEFDSPVGGVFAASPDGKRAIFDVKDLLVSEGNYPKEEFSRFKLSYADGKIPETAVGEKLEYILETETISGINENDVNITFTSSNNGVLSVSDDGTLLPGKAGKATITAVAKMGLKSISATTDIEVTDVDPTMYKENFDSSKELPSYMTLSGNKEAKIADGALRIFSTNGGGATVVNFDIDQPEGRNAYFEFDFRQHCGTTSPTTGAGVLYGNGQSFAMTCDVGRFNWFFEDDQRYIMSIEQDRWYHIKIYIDYKNQYANVWVDDELVVDKGVLKTVATYDNSFLVRAWRVGTDTYFDWDNFNFYFEK